MANESKTTKNVNKTNKNLFGNINSLIDKLHASAFGTSSNTDIDRLNDRFSNFLQAESDTFNRSNTQDNNQSFIQKLFDKNDNNLSNNNQEIIDQLTNIFDNKDMDSMAQSFMDEVYKNKLLKLNDLHEVSTQLIELREAILITRDAIISSDIVEGRMSRLLKFDATGSNNNAKNVSTTESMEKKFGLQNKIKDFIIPRTLEYGLYYAYTIPYSKIFSDFMKYKEKRKNKMGIIMGESTLYENIRLNEDYDDFTKIFTESYSIHNESNNSKENKETIIKNNELKSIFDSNLKSILENVSICNDAIPLPVMEEGYDSIKFFGDKCVDEVFNEKNYQIDDIGSDSYFNTVMKTTDAGTYDIKDKKDKDSKDYEKDFKKIHDCYIKMIDPKNMKPIKIMNKVIGYYYQTAEEISGVNGSILSPTRNGISELSNLQNNSNLVDIIAKKIVKSFNKDFLMNNPKFKELIMESLMYYNLNTTKIRYQFIPAEYITEFKISEDEYGNGTSMIEGSLFYAKLYLMLLLFKMMSIILYSNDTRVNYIKNSGIDKNVRKKIEEIARIKQQRQINVMDMFSYTGLINKIGIGTETYIPTGRSGERGIETEILQGQDVQMNSDLMDNLKKGYILGTGVPDAIINYLNEADFAKSVELANTRYLGRVVNYQLDFNEGITKFYQQIMKYSTDIEDMDINGFEFSFAPPKNTNTQIKGDMIGNFETFATWVLGMTVGQNELDNPENTEVVKLLKRSLAEDYLPMINFKTIDDAYQNAMIKGTGKNIKPKGEEVFDDGNLGI